MTGLRNRPNSSSRFAQLGCEQLETRDCPAAIFLNAAVIGAHQVELTGQITDGPSAGIQVNFSGAVNGSTITASDGTFSYITTDAALGTVYAIGVEDNIEITNIASDDLVSAVPQILDFQALNTHSVFWTFSGQVRDDFVEGLVLRMGGAANGLNVTLTEGGYFTITVMIEEPALSMSWASVVDWWGLESNQPYCYMY